MHIHDLSTCSNFLRTIKHSKIFFSTSEPPIPPPQETWETNLYYRAGLVWFYKPPEDELLPILSEQFDFFILTHRDEESRDILRSLGGNCSHSRIWLKQERQDRRAHQLYQFLKGVLAIAFRSAQDRG